MSTIGELLDQACTLSGESARLDTEVLLAHVLAKPRSYLYTWPELEVADPGCRQFNGLMERRRSGEPVAYLAGSREFWSLELAVDDSTLIPRPETELLVEWALELELNYSAQLLDLGTGTGAIALALRAERPSWEIVGCDNNQSALRLAQSNAERLQLPGISWILSDWYQALGTRTFDLILSNPPYIASGDPHLQQGDVRYEPRSALVSPRNGLSDLERIIDGAVEHLAQGGWLLLEHGHQQGAAVRARLQDNGFGNALTRMDLAGCERATGAQWMASGDSP